MEPYAASWRHTYRTLLGNNASTSLWHLTTPPQSIFLCSSSWFSWKSSQVETRLNKLQWDPYALIREQRIRFWLRGVDHGDWGSCPWKYVGGVRVCFDHLNVTFFHSNLLLDNSAIFISWRMKNLCQKWKVKPIFRGAFCKRTQFDGLTWLTPTPIFYDRSTPLFWLVWRTTKMDFKWIVSVAS